MSDDIQRAPSQLESPWIVLKFGGTSVTGLEQWHNIKRILTRHIETKQPLLIVCSAISQVSNHLERLARAAQAGEDFESPESIEPA